MLNRTYRVITHTIHRKTSNVAYEGPFVDTRNVSQNKLILEYGENAQKEK